MSLCKYCKEEIVWKQKGSKWIPLESITSDKRHECPKVSLRVPSPILGPQFRGKRYIVGISGETGSYRLITYGSKEELSRVSIPDGKTFLKELAARMGIKCKIS